MVSSLLLPMAWLLVPQQPKTIPSRWTRGSNHCHHCHVHVVIVAPPSRPSAIILQPPTHLVVFLFVGCHLPPPIDMADCCVGLMGLRMLSTFSSPIRSSWLLSLPSSSLSAPSLHHPMTPPPHRIEDRQNDVVGLGKRLGCPMGEARGIFVFN